MTRPNDAGAFRHGAWMRPAAAVVLSMAPALALQALAQAPAPPSPPAPAAVAVEDPALEARVQRLAAELRCLVCQNQTIADSNADLAVDLRRQVREMLQQGRSDREVLDFMTARYGDFVLYRPPVRGNTALLWFGPGVLLVGGLAGLWWVLRRRAALPDDQFEPDLGPSGDDDDDGRPPIALPPDTVRAPGPR